MTAPRVDVHRLTDADLDAAVGGLADVLLDSIRDGASIGFLAGLTPDAAAAWWRAALDAPGTLTWVAREQEPAVVVLGCVQLRLAPEPTGRHRGDVAKLLVHSGARRRGVATALLLALEDDARARGLTLLLLDTQTGTPAESLYRRLGWTAYGTVPDHAAAPDGQLTSTTFFYRRLSPS